MTTDDRMAFAAHLAQYSSVPGVVEAGAGWFALNDRLRGRADLTRDERRLKARYEKVIAGARAAPDQQEADPP